MKPACDCDEDRYYDDDSGQYQKDYDLRLKKDLILISRLALYLYEDKDGPPITHITGYPISDILDAAKAYAPGLNIGCHMPHEDFPINKRTC